MRAQATVSPVRGTRASLSRYLCWAEQARSIEPSCSPRLFRHAVANPRVARLLASRPDRFFGFAFVNRFVTGARLPHGRGSGASYGFLGIKVHRHDARITREICEARRLIFPFSTT